MQQLHALPLNFGGTGSCDAGGGRYGNAGGGSIALRSC
ncbi:hypothetical protein MPS_3884 [Mycobacterium pseudoshottsii JCM 15466]|nr:hypothetical protein MMSP_4459 [Mycobacterium sp. 012931]EPQ77817.1 hypothetical protein MMMB2_2479 [Mycobacterium marinum MB2]GAQ37852.1 hypothetical protein MPS_3884 [Mycobacterium pseudoshottsii JCM 15466]